ncbi:MAG: DUF892 family protein [Pirellulales bacterium]
MSRSPQDQLVHFLSDMYSVEQQALAQLVSAPDIAKEPTLAGDFRQHHAETEHQAQRVRERLEACGGSPSAIKDAVMKLGGKGFLLFAQIQPETPGRLVVHAYSYEAMEWAGYEMLRRFAERVGDNQTVETARAIGAQEREMMERLARGFNAAEQAAHVETPPHELKEHVAKHLAEVHAFESQGMQLLKKSENIAGDPSLEAIYSEHAERMQVHARLVEQRLDTLSSDASGVMDAAMGLGGLNWGLFFQAQQDTPAKLAAFVYAFLHLEIGGYELLKRTALRNGDAETEQLCDTILAEKRAMAERLAGAFDVAVQATLDAVQA